MLDAGAGRCVSGLGAKPSSCCTDAGAGRCVPELGAKPSSCCTAFEPIAGGGGNLRPFSDELESFLFVLDLVPPSSFESELLHDVRVGVVAIISPKRAVRKTFFIKKVCFDFLLSIVGFCL